jgi:hypothetical protein
VGRAVGAARRRQLAQTIHESLELAAAELTVLILVEGVEQPLGIGGPETAGPIRTTGPAIAGTAIASGAFGPTRRTAAAPGGVVVVGTRLVPPLVAKLARRGAFSVAELAVAVFIESLQEARRGLARRAFRRRFRRGFLLSERDAGQRRRDRQSSQAGEGLHDCLW